MLIRRWVPELRPLPATDLHEPWRLDAHQQQVLGWQLGRDYPAPIIDVVAAGRAARDRQRNRVSVVAGQSNAAQLVLDLG